MENNINPIRLKPGSSVIDPKEIGLLEYDPQTTLSQQSYLYEIENLN